MNGSRRSDVQGLRAVAVLLVVAFHAGLPVPGGFVGVDVFFVISGFVITGMLQREWSSTGRVSFGRFYLRRFKRLAPALALVVAVTTILSFGLLSPIGIQQRTALTGVGATLLVANFVIARNTGDYFDLPAGTNPLLHTWSLSVEEQFYLMFPAILVLGWAHSRRGRRLPWTTVLVGAMALASFWLAVVGVEALSPVYGLLSRWWQVTVDSGLGFYGPFARAWEFAVGALLALVTMSRSLGDEKHARLLAWLGVALLAASAWLIDENTPFPGPWTLLPVGGTLLLIAAGTQHSTWVNRALAIPAMVKIGDWSYSIYLWHWPLTVFAVTLWPQVRFANILAAILSILPAVASYRWVERPLRQLPSLTARRSFALIGAVVCPPVLLATTLDFAANHYWLPRYRSGAMTTHEGDTGWEDFYFHLSHSFYPCSDRAIRDSAPKFYSQWGEITRCGQSKPGSRIDVALVGDSHAEHLFVGLAAALPDKNIVYYIGAATLPVRSAPGMSRIIDDVASDPGIKTVIISALWAREGVAANGLVNTLETFRSSGKTVFVADDVPTFKFDAVSCKFRLAPILPFPMCSENRKLFAAAYARYYPELSAAVRKVPGVQLLNTAQYFCDNELCAMNKGQYLLYRDRNHLNYIGSRYLADRLLYDCPQFKDAVMRP